MKEYLSLINNLFFNPLIAFRNNYVLFTLYLIVICVMVLFIWRTYKKKKSIK